MFVPDRENDELTVALNKPEHPGRTRGYGSKSSKTKKTKEMDRVKSLEEDLAKTKASRGSTSVGNCS